MKTQYIIGRFSTRGKFSVVNTTDLLVDVIEFLKKYNQPAIGKKYVVYEKTSNELIDRLLKSKDDNWHIRQSEIEEGK